MAKRGLFLFAGLLGLLSRVRSFVDSPWQEIRTARLRQASVITMYLLSEVSPITRRTLWKQMWARSCEVLPNFDSGQGWACKPANSKRSSRRDPTRYFRNV